MSQPSVVFIDDSATMREVIKIAFRRENFDVFAFADPNAALDHVETQPPDVIITDVIMPDHDGYQVCEYIKQHPTLAATPVILMSGVVNREVAEKAFAVKAAELVRKPFQPQDLISRVKQLVHPAKPQEPAAVDPTEALSSIFAAPSKPGTPEPALSLPKGPPPKAATTAPLPDAVTPIATAGQPRPATSDQSVQVLRLESLVRKLQAELAAERDYANALEEHIKTLQETKYSKLM